MSTMIGSGATLVILMLLGMMIGLADRQRFAFRWLLIATFLVAIHDAFLTLVY